jgi:hypothetical protein
LVFLSLTINLYCRRPEVAGQAKSPGVKLFVLGVLRLGFDNTQGVGKRARYEDRRAVK